MLKNGNKNPLVTLYFSLTKLKLNPFILLVLKNTFKDIVANNDSVTIKEILGTIDKIAKDETLIDNKKVKIFKIFITPKPLTTF